MNGYERALHALHFETTDYVATWGGWIVSASFFEYVTGKRFWDDPLSIAIDAYRKLGVDIVVQSFYLPNSPEEWRSHTEIIKEQEKYKSVEDVVAYIGSLPEPYTLEKEFDFEGELKTKERAYLDFQEKLSDNIFCMPSCKCAKFTWYMEFGYENYLMVFALYPEAIRKLFEYAGETARLTNMVLAELVERRKVPPFFFTGHDICGKKGPMVSPDILRSFYFPNLCRSLEPLVEIGAEIIWHSDGYIIPIINDLINCGVSGFQGFQEDTGFDIRNISERKVRSGRRPLLLAGISVDRILPFGTISDVEREVERIIGAVGLEGGLAIGTANTAGPDCPSENLEVLYRYAHQYKRSNPT